MESLLRDSLEELSELFFSLCEGLGLDGFTK